MTTYTATVGDYLYTFIENKENRTLSITAKYKKNKEKLLNYYRFPTIERLEKYRLEFITAKQIRQEKKGKYNEEMKAAKDKLKVEELKKYNIGDILYNSRGYEQTNIDYYQITERKGSKIYIKAIGGELVSTESSMSKYTKPVKDNFLKEEYKTDQNGWKIIGPYGINFKHGAGGITREEEKHFSSSRA